MSNSAVVEKQSDELCVSEVYSLLPMLMLGTLLLEAAELTTLGTGTDGAEEAAIGESRRSPPCRLLGRWFSMSASSEVYFRFRLFRVRGSVMSDVDDLLASSELYTSIIHGALWFTD